MQKNPLLKTILSAAGADGVGTAINVEYYKNKELILDSDGGADAEMVVKFVGSYQKDEPDFEAAQTPANSWVTLNVKTLSGSSSNVVAGDTGVTFSGGDKHLAFNVENNNIVWLSAIVSGYVRGEVTLKVKSGNDY